MSLATFNHNSLDSAPSVTKDAGLPQYADETEEVLVMRQYRYRPLLRPASCCTLPRGLDWDFVEKPAWMNARPCLPVSRHPYGVIATARELTLEEISRFDLAPMPKVSA